jgi:hypothetical protein
MDLFHKLPEFAQSALVTQRIRAFFEEKGQSALSLSIVRVILRKQTCTIVLSQAVARTEMRLHVESVQKLL